MFFFTILLLASRFRLCIAAVQNLCGSRAHIRSLETQEKFQLFVESQKSFFFFAVFSCLRVLQNAVNHCVKDFYECEIFVKFN